MRILTRYLCAQFGKLLGICLLVFTAIYLIVDFLQRIDNFLDAGAPAGAMLKYFLYKTPFIVVHMSPVAALIAVIILFSLLNKNNEIIALKACGVSMLRLSFPVLAASLGLAVAVFLLSEIVMPYASSRTQAIWYKEVKKSDPSRFYGRNHIWYKGPASIYWIKHFDDRDSIMQSPTFYFFDDDFALTMKVRGRRAVWTGENWRVLQGSVQTADSAGDYRYREFRKLDLELAEGPEAFLKNVRRPEEMGYWELKRYAANIRREGYDAAPYFVDMHIKLAFPLISFVMVLMGVPVALLRKQGGAPLSVSIGISVCFLYLLTLGIARSFGLSGALPPVLAAWFANGLFFLIGIYLLMRTDT